ncbi:MAG: HAD family hydrolase [Anaerovoracaceae bacterium]
MNRKRITAILLTAAMTVTAAAFPAAGFASTKRTKLKNSSWNPDVKTAVNTLVSTYGKGTKKYSRTEYAVFDFDNTSSIFDVGEQLAIYQLDHMAFAFGPDKMPEILATGIEDSLNEKTGPGYSAKEGTYKDWIDDINDAYTALWNKYGPFTAKGVDEKTAEKLRSDSDYMEFAAKMRAFYDIIMDNFSTAVAYPWNLYWFTGMTAGEKYALAKRSHHYYKNVDTAVGTWTSPYDDTRVGKVTATYNIGIQVTGNIRELYKTLDKNGIKVWICSASDIEVVKAAVDEFGLHDHVTGVIAMTNKIGSDGKYINAYDYGGHPAYALDGGKWKTASKYTTKNMTLGGGKVTAINNVLVKKYGHGPIAGFMDSTGDFQFCTEYKSLKLVTCFNRASRKVTDGGGLIAEVAYYQKYILKYDLKKANKKKDTYYVLQGRDETGKRSFRPSMMTLRYGRDDQLMFANSDNWMQLAYMIEHKMSTKSAINKFAVATSAENSSLGFAYGFTGSITSASSLKNDREPSTTFTGYHSLR